MSHLILQPKTPDSRLGGTFQPTESRQHSSLSAADRFVRSLVVAAVSLVSASALYAQDPFAQDVVPTFSITDNYVEVLKYNADDGYFVDGSDALSSFTITAKASTSGMNLSELNADSPFEISVGDFEISGVLGDDPSYTPGATSIRIPILDSDYDTGDDIKVGQATISWGSGVVTAKVQVSRPDTYTIATTWYAGTTDPVEDVLSATFSFGDRSLDGRNLYITGTANVATRKAGSGANADSYDLSTVKISGSIDSERPTVKLAGTPDGSVVDAEAITLTAKATDNIGVVDVQVQVNDDEDFNSLDQVDDNTWSMDGVSLNYGDNIIRLKSIDEDGNESLVQQVVVKRWTGVTINVSGDGKIPKTFSGTTLREVGSIVNVKATPNDGSIFSGWTGSSSTSSANLVFIVQPGQSFTANFIPNPFVALKGSYTGMVNAGDSGIGSFNVQLVPAGSFTGKVVINGRSETLNGSFDATGHFTGVLSKNGLPLVVDLQVDLNGGSDSISGTIKDGANTFAVNGDRSIYNAQNPAPQAGYYTLSLPSSDVAGSPQGDGYATLDIAKNGTASFVGALPDGTSISFSAPLSKSGKLPIFVTPYNGKGLLSGVVVFQSTPGVGDLSATLHWVKAPSATTDGFYVAGFDTQTSVVGARYKAPGAGNRALNLAATANNGVVAIGEGGLGSSITKAITLAANNRVTVGVRGADKLAVDITASTGLFSGSFVEPITGKTRRFNGVILQSQNIGTGVFRGGFSAGYVNITTP